MVRKIKIAFIILIVILTVSCKNNNQSKNDVIGSSSPLPFVTSSAIDDYSFNLENDSQKKKDSNMNQELVKEFWINNGVSDELVYNLTTPNSTKSENDTKGNMERIDYKQFLKEFWKSKKDLLEKASCDMKASEIDYVFNGKAFVIKDGIPSRIETDYPDSVDLILEQSEGKIKEFGWSRTPEPMFTEGENYFYFKTPRFYNEYGSEIAISLVYTENPKETIEYEYEALSSNWYLVTLYYGE